MSKQEYKIPAKFLNIVKPVLLRDERIIYAFHESFSFHGDTILPKWTLLTNLKLIFLIHELPGMGVYEYYLEGMSIELFQDNIGLYNTISFILNDNELYKLQVFKKKWSEAQFFVHEVQKSIGQIEHELRSEDMDSESNTNTPENKEKKMKCNNEKHHLKDLASMGVITPEEYKEETEKLCKE